MMKTTTLIIGIVLLLVAGMFVAPRPTSAIDCNYCWCGLRGADGATQCLDNIGRRSACEEYCGGRDQVVIHCDDRYLNYNDPAGDGFLAEAPSCADVPGGAAAPAQCPCSCETPSGGVSLGLRVPDQCRNDCRARGGTPVCPPDIPPGGAAPPGAPGGGAAAPAGPVQGPAKYEQGELCKDCDLTKINPLGTTSIPTILGRLINAFLGIMGSLALAVFVYGGFTWLTSAGSPEKITKGRNILIWAALGIVVVFAAYTLVNFVLTRIIGVL